MDEQREIESTESQSNANTTVFFDVLNTIPTVCSLLMSYAAFPEQNNLKTDNEVQMADKVNKRFTIKDTVFGNIDIFDIDYSRILGSTSSDGKNENKIDRDPATEENATDVIKKQVAIWYVAIRNLTIVLLLLVLIYLGIRMALASVATQKANYKKMLIHWATSFALLFMLHYIIFFSVNISNMLLTGIDQTGIRSIEDDLINGTKVNAEDKDLYRDGHVIAARTRTNKLTKTYKWMEYSIPVNYLLDISIL